LEKWSLTSFRNRIRETLYILAGICYVGLLYIIFEVYETKGMSKDEIRKLFIKTNHGVYMSDEIEPGGNTSQKKAYI
jgi:hypothetical protein